MELNDCLEEVYLLLRVKHEEEMLSLSWEESQSLQV